MANQRITPRARAAVTVIINVTRVFHEFCGAKGESP
jgi:hypothetical protein